MTSRKRSCIIFRTHAVSLFRLDFSSKHTDEWATWILPEHARILEDSSQLLANLESILYVELWPGLFQGNFLNQLHVNKRFHLSRHQPYTSGTGTLGSKCRIAQRHWPSVTVMFWTVFDYEIQSRKHDMNWAVQSRFGSCISANFDRGG